MPSVIASNDGPFPASVATPVANPEGPFTTEPTNALNPDTYQDAGPFLGLPIVKVLAIAPASGPHTGGTTVNITVSDSDGVTGAAVGGIALIMFVIVDHVTVEGTTQTGMATGANDVTVTNGAGTGTGTGLFTGT